MAFRSNDGLNLSLKGNSVQPPGNASSRPYSARSNSQTRQPTTSARTGSARDHRTNTNINSSARQRRNSNSGPRPAWLKSPTPDVKQSTSAASNGFRITNSQHDDVDAFFTDRQQHHEHSSNKRGDDEEWDDTRRWVDELNLNTSFSPHQQSRGVGPIDMSRDSMNGGTMASTHLLQSGNNRRGQQMPASQIAGIAQSTPMEADLRAKTASITIQRWYRKVQMRRKMAEAALKRVLEQKKIEHQASMERAKELEKLSILEQKKNREDKHRQTRLTAIKEAQQRRKQLYENQQKIDEHRPSTPNQRPSSARHRTNPSSSILPPSSPHVDEKMMSPNSTTSSSSKVTLTDVYETLRKLEEVEQFPIQTMIENDSAYSIDPTTNSTVVDEPPPPQAPNRVNSILSYLDEANRNEVTLESVRSQKLTNRETSAPTTVRFATPPQSSRQQQQPKKLAQSVSVPQNRASPSIDQQTKQGNKVTAPHKSLMVPAQPIKLTEEDDEDDDEREATLTAQGVTDTVLQLRMDNEDKQRQTIILQQRLNQQRELNIRHAKESERELEHRLQLQKDDYEATIQRHLSFIDQLIDDKKKLSERCERLVAELKTIDKKSGDRIKNMEESHRIELQKLKDVHEAAEKLRRERWIEEKTKKIKELTVRGLEPEIQKLIGKHKTELAKMKTVHEAELLAADERAAQRYVRLTEDLRDQLEREKESAIARERDSARDKYEKAIRDEEKSFAEQRRRLYAEIEDEKNRQAELSGKQRADLDKLRRDIEDNHRTAVDAAKREYEAVRLEQERRHTNEINELKEKLLLEKQSWEENYMKKQETSLAGKERELREHMKRERDKEIEKIISQFESDTSLTKEEAERTAENRVKRIRDKYEAEFRELEHSERQTKDRYNQMKAQMTEVEGENERLQVILRQKETEVTDIKKITETLQKERERLSDIIRQEFADRLVLTEEENRRIKGDMAELRARQQIESDKKKEEIELLQREKEKELETVHEKIKQAISKKDEQVQALRGQFEAAVKRADHLEGLLAQQRKLIAAPPSNGTSAQKKALPS
ncbi:unnamed protein product [Rotaria socialis]|uniref:5-azacytidine-induced protein 1 n=2 Tax=Rotaria socialis TaxID=392032 RepID=A0A818CBV3_9BILA|nr:unnamed protein product [Rotaria socialis]CAF3426895.1 unnamed protein product [Rotaria socialis]